MSEEAKKIVRDQGIALGMSWEEANSAAAKFVNIALEAMGREPIEVERCEDSEDWGGKA